MIEFLLFCVAATGMSHILVDGSIFSSFKAWLGNGPSFFGSKLLELMNCYQCTGFWSGFFIYFLMSADDLSWSFLPMSFVYACAGSFVSMLGAVILMWMQSQSPNE